MIRKVRALTNTATAEIRENLGPGFEDLTPSDLNPKTFIKRHVASVIEEDVKKEKMNSKESAIKPQIDPDLL
jgi:sec-independent protein translocase protein TatB